MSPGFRLPNTSTRSPSVTPFLHVHPFGAAVAVADDEGASVVVTTLVFGTHNCGAAGYAPAI